MDLYLLTRTDRALPDEAAGFVVAATTYSHARQLAAAQHGDEPKRTWLYANYSDAAKIGTATHGTHAAVILRDFRAA